MATTPQKSVKNPDKIVSSALCRNRLRLTAVDFCGHYYIPLLFGGMILVFYHRFLYEFFIHGTPIPLPGLLAGVGIPILVILVIRWVMLFFSSVEAQLTPKEFNFVMKRLARFYGMNAFYRSDTLWMLYGRESVANSMLRVTVIRAEDKILVNSIMVPQIGRGHRLTSLGGNLRETDLLVAEFERYAAGKSRFGTVKNPIPDPPEPDPKKYCRSTRLPGW